MAKGFLLVLFAFGVWVAEGIEIDLNSDRWNSLNLRTPQSLKDDPRCTKNGMYAIPDDCTSYLLCRGGKGKVRKCPTGFQFDSVKHCTPDEADCGKTNMIHVSAIRCPKFYGTFEFPGDCHKYLACFEGRPFVLTCPEGTGYRQGIGCSEGVKCSSSEPSVSLGDDDEEREKTCEPGLTEKSGDNYDCTVYHECRNGVVRTRRCRSGKYFDSVTKACVEKERAHCLFKCLEPNGVYPIASAVNKYIECRDGKPRVKTCPTGRIFDPEQSQCVKREDNKNDVLDILSLA